MLKIWYGPEMEGRIKGQNTLFICSNSLINIDSFVSYLEDQNLNISRVYLGAGRTEFLGFVSDSQYEIFLKICLRRKIHIIIETTTTDISSYEKLLSYLDLEIILTIRNSIIPISTNICLKLDNYVVARIFDNTVFYDTNIVGVKDSYNCDTILVDQEGDLYE